MRTQATIIIEWPDAKWQPATEVEYLESCTTGIVEQMRRGNFAQTGDYMFFNRYGRLYATMKVEVVP